MIPMAIYDPQDDMHTINVQKHIDTNYKIFTHIYDFSIISDIIVDGCRTVTWDGDITEHMQYHNGQWVYHRIGEPAIESNDPIMVAYYAWGEIYIDTKEYCEACGLDDITTMTLILKHGSDLPYF